MEPEGPSGEMPCVIGSPESDARTSICIRNARSGSRARVLSLSSTEFLPLSPSLSLSLSNSLSFSPLSLSLPLPLSPSLSRSRLQSLSFLYLARNGAVDVLFGTRIRNSSVRPLLRVSTNGQTPFQTMRGRCSSLGAFSSGSGVTTYSAFGSTEW